MGHFSAENCIVRWSHMPFLTTVQSACSVNPLMKESHVNPPKTRNSQDLWIGVSRYLTMPCRFFGPFDEFALLERGSCPDGCDEVGGVDGTPACLY